MNLKSLLEKMSQIDEMDYGGGKSPHAGHGLSHDDDDGKKEFKSTPVTKNKMSDDIARLLTNVFDKELDKNIKEESTETKDQHAEKAGKKVAKDIEYDEDHKGKDDNRAEKAGEKVTKDIEYDDKKKEIDESSEDNPVASAITQRIIHSHTDLLAKYGPKAVMDAIDSIADQVGDTEEIGSSDVSGWVKQVVRDLSDLNEGDISTRLGDKGETIRRHTAKAGGYGRKIDTDDETGDKFHSSDFDDEPVKKSGQSRRGAPEKNADPLTGNAKKFDTDTLSSWIIGNKPKNIDKIGKVSHVNRLKEHMAQIESKMISESLIAEGKMKEVAMLLQDILDGEIEVYDIVTDRFKPSNPVEVMVANKVKELYREIESSERGYTDDDFEKIIDDVHQEIEHLLSGQKSLEEAGEQVTIAPAQTSTQVIKQGDKVLGQIQNPQLASTIKQALGTGQMTLSGGKLPGMNESVAHNMADELKDVLSRYPHEHKMAQEGWGMDEGLYEALCDHYHKEGKIPRSIWHGPSEELRRHVEECYLQDTQPIMGEGEMSEGLGGAIAGGALGALAAGPMGAVRGASIGSSIQNAFTDESMFENKKPSSGMTKKEKSSLVKKAKAGKDIGKPGKGFEKVAKAAGGGEKGKKIAAAAMWKNAAKEDINEYAGFDSPIKTRKEPTLNLPKIEPKPGHSFDRKQDKERSLSSDFSMSRRRNYMEEPDDDMSIANLQAMSASRNRKNKITKLSPNRVTDVDSAKIPAAIRKARGDAPLNYKDLRESDEMINQWDQALSSLLKEAIAVTTSADKSDAPETVNVSATQQDAELLKKLLQSAGLGDGAESINDKPVETPGEYNGTEYDGAGSPAITVKDIDADAAPDSETDTGEVPPYGDNKEIHREVPVMAMPLGMAMSRNPEVDVEAEHIEPATPDEVIDDLGANVESPANDGDAVLAMIKKLIGHGANSDIQVATVATEDKSEECSVCGHSPCECDDQEKVDEAEMEEGNEFTGKREQAIKAGKSEFNVGGKTYKVTGDTSDEKVEEDTASDDAAEAGVDIDEAKQACNECGEPMSHGHECSSQDDYRDERLNEWANSQGGKNEDEEFKTEMEFMTKLISGGLNNMKQDQTTLPSARVKTASETNDVDLSMAAQLRKLSGIN